LRRRERRTGGAATSFVCAFEVVSETIAKIDPHLPLKEAFTVPTTRQQQNIRTQEIQFD